MSFEYANLIFFFSYKEKAKPLGRSPLLDPWSCVAGGGRGLHWVRDPDLPPTRRVTSVGHLYGLSP